MTNELYTLEELDKAFDKAMDRPVAYHRIFFELTNSPAAAIMLSQAWYWSTRTNDPDGWFWKTQQGWEEETGLTRRFQETARKALLKLGFWQEELRGNPAKLFFRIDRKLIKLAIVNLAKKDAPTISIEEESHPIDGQSQQSQYGATRQSSMAQPAILSMAQPANLVWRNPPNYLYTESTTENTREYAETTVRARAQETNLPNERPVDFRRKKISTDAAVEQDGRAVIQMVRDRFMYLDRDSSRLAAALAEDYNERDIATAIDQTYARHQEMIVTGSKGILAPLAYTRKILEENARPKPKMCRARVRTQARDGTTEEIIDTFSVAEATAMKLEIVEVL